MSAHLQEPGMKTRVVISGIGVWCCFGRGVSALRSAMINGDEGRQTITDSRSQFPRNGLRTSEACSISDDDFLQLRGHDASIITSLGRAVVADAFLDAGLTEDEVHESSCGLIIGTTIGGGFAYLSHYRARHGLLGGDLRAVVSACTPAAITGVVADDIGLRGPTCAISTACAASSNAIGRAAELIRLQRTDIMVAGGLDLFSDLSLSGFNSLQALARDGSRPFEDDRDGLILGDAGAVVVLESLARAEARGARPYAEVAGYGILNEAFHATGPDPSGVPAASVMRHALADGGLSAETVDYVNAHGTGTVANDAMEAAALRLLFGDRLSKVAVSATKASTGHALGSAGALEAAITAIAVRDQFVPTSSPERSSSVAFADLNVVRGPSQRLPIRVALSNSFGFGGNVASIAFAALSGEG